MLFYATVARNLLRDYMPADVAYLLPASSWASPSVLKLARSGMDDGQTFIRDIPPVKLPAHVQHVAADCGGFVATFKWGDYKYLASSYVAWCRSIGTPLRWAATMDLCVEPEITQGDRRLIRHRQDETTRMADTFWQQYADAPWAWVPTLQGWEVDDYVRHARQMAPLVAEMQSFYAERLDMSDAEDAETFDRYERNMLDFRVGIGTLCRRASARQIRDVVSAVRAELPNVPLHLWGVKLSSLAGGGIDGVTSVDSAAWNGRFAQGMERYAASTLSQAEHGYRIELPSYLDKVERAIGSSVRTHGHDAGGLKKRFQRPSRHIGRNQR